MQGSECVKLGSSICEAGVFCVIFIYFFGRSLLLPFRSHCRWLRTPSQTRCSTDSLAAPTLRWRPYCASVITFLALMWCFCVLKRSDWREKVVILSWKFPTSCFNDFTRDFSLRFVCDWKPPKFNGIRGNDRKRILSSAVSIVQVSGGVVVLWEKAESVCLLQYFLFYIGRITKYFQLMVNF